MFRLISKLKPAGDQPRAIERLIKNLETGVKKQVLLGVTGSGKTYTCAKVIERIQKPALWISHNKTLAAQVFQEFKEFFPRAGVHFFTSYYDYYQPEAYIPQTDTYIEKDAKINEEIDRLRHAAVQDLLSRKDIIIIASVSCIYNIGSPEDYQKVSLEIKTNQKLKRKDLLSCLTSLQYRRNDIDFKPGNFRIRGSIIEIYSVTGEEILQIETFNDRIESIKSKKNAFDSKYKTIDSFKLFPAHFWVTPQQKLNIAIENLRLELQEQLKKLKKQKKLVEWQKLSQRTNYDQEMIRKKTLIDYGFRLPSAVDNRPLRFDEFEKSVNQTIYVSATPGEYENQKIKK